MAGSCHDTQHMVVRPIGVLQGDFGGRFGTPRQAGLTPSARGVVLLTPPFARAEALEGLAEYSHVWLLFWFHGNRAPVGRSLTVRPPRLGGNRRLGVFATRSPYRPNPIGLSLVRCAGMVQEPGRFGLRVEGHDLIDGTPILDIKPYLAYADRVQQACVPAEFAGAPPTRLAVHFATEAMETLRRHPDGERLQRLIRETLALDPRPVYRGCRGDGCHGMRLAGLEVRWRMRGKAAEVESLEAV